MSQEVEDQIYGLLEKLSQEEAGHILLTVSERLILLKRGEEKERAIQVHRPAKIEPAKLLELFSERGGLEAPDNKIGLGLRRVSFSLENFEFQNNPAMVLGKLTGPRYFDTIPALYCFGSGDWEFPVFFIIYLDSDGKTFRSYVPKKGNSWNHNTNRAFGNDQDEDREFFVKWIAEHKPGLPFNPERFDSIHHPRLMMSEEEMLQDIREAFSGVLA